MRVACALLGIGLLPVGLRGATEPDAAVTRLLAGGAIVLHRAAASEELDLVVAGSKSGDNSTGEYWWGQHQTVGIYLQRRGMPGLVYRVTEETGEAHECFTRVERATASEIVLSCQPEKGMAAAHRKFVYDARAKALIRRVTIGPYPFKSVRADGNTATITGDSRMALVFDGAKFRVTTGTPVERRGARFGPYTVSVAENRAPQLREKSIIPLPQSSYEEFASARPGRVRDGYVRGAAKIREWIGPWMIAEGTLWFGKVFADGEGLTGVGGFGYFDLERKAFRVFSPAEARDFSVNALLVEKEAVWLGLVRNGEWGSTGAGLLRFDRATEKVERFPIREIVGGIGRAGEWLVLATEFGVAVLEGGVVRRYFVDEGGKRVVEALAP